MKAGSNSKAATDTGEQGRALAIAHSRQRRQGGPTQHQQQPGNWEVTECQEGHQTVRRLERVTNKPNKFLAEGTQQRMLGSVSDSSWVCCSQTGQEEQNCRCSEAVGQDPRLSNLSAGLRRPTSAHPSLLHIPPLPTPPPKSCHYYSPSSGGDASSGSYSVMMVKKCSTDQRVNPNSGFLRIQDKGKTAQVIWWCIELELLLKNERYFHNF